MSAPPIFVGGTGRCGTHAVGHLLGATTRYAMVPRELQFHISRLGLSGFVRARITAEELARNLRTHWWSRTTGWDAETTRGLYKSLSRDALEAAIERFLSDDEGSRGTRAGTLLDDIARSSLVEPTTAAWVEMTPLNVSRADSLEAFSPDHLLIHVVRDGRDVAASITALPWGPDEPLEALEWWESRLRVSSSGAQAVPPARRLVVRLEELTWLDREQQLERLMAFAGCAIDEPVRRFFDERVRAADARIGRWRTAFEPTVRAELDRRYRRLLEALMADGVDATPTPPERLDAEAPPAPQPVENPLDPWRDGLGRTA